ncbi:ATP-binding protein [Massilia sp. CF038]|uniref:ATP-binding protein n=1 Tax=Massilia sp. CF038 TaxID=1881045 RepID=UPI0009233BAC|nr:ATP-binding protein [Massilia sp. CF038]SHH18083.1 two-component system, OmpR family, sensor histidine kinase BaeS [Massilia sp. CF038]
MRLTIARKIALAVIAIVILCVGTMAWVASINLQRGFVAYLNQVQAKDIEQMSSLLARRYRDEGNFDWLRHRPRAITELLAQMTPQLQAEGGLPARRLPTAPERFDERPRDMRERPGMRDPMGIAPRLSIFDADGEPLFGPREVPRTIERAVVVDGRTVATIRLRPLVRTAGEDATASLFLREQVRDIVLVACILVLVSVLLAFWLARHLLRPVAALREVTARLAQGQFEARAPLLSRDELAELALHVNAMAQALESSERDRRKLLADVAHELRTPLTVIRGEIEALIDGIRTADTSALASLHAEVLRLNKLVDDLHQLTLADAGGLQFEWQRVDLGALLAPLLARYRERAAGAGLALDVALAPRSMPVRADAHRLTQLFVNLLENSVRYTDSGGRIAVSLSGEGAWASVVVEDSAPGVPVEALEAIFERLYRVDAARSRARGGSGLGLSICKAMASAHGGTLAAYPSQLGGVRMELRLPLEGGKQ